MRKITAFVLTSLLIVTLACDRTPSGETAIADSAPTSATFNIETVITGLQVPWSIVWAPDGRMFFTERIGRVRVFENGKLRPEPVFTVPDVDPTGESGLMSIALHPQFNTNHYVYLSYAYSQTGVLVRVVRYKESPEGFIEPKVIIENIPAAQYHAGCRVRFGPDGKLYITTGDGTKRELAQQLNSLAGKTLRLNDDGTVPDDNPFVGRQDARPEIWSYGHRNSQGMDWQPGSNLMFQTEHGPSGFDGPEGGDEVNIVEKGKNYGWPIIHHKESKAGLESPLLEYTPACAPASGMFYRGTVFPQFKGNFFFGCLHGAALMRVELNGRSVVKQESIVKNYGRIRDVAEGPDGFLYFSTSNRDGRGKPSNDDDRILRIVPAK
ncbi:MAG TPA: PQQ-dependent sugar dehydrogenase [Pyrinomonadaceae bacterium]|nr:PQQ-dependent sugar dehydrogenase [Pyrinomonadaceae bacterium]